jgi:Uma2 family endonuclease
MERRLRYPAGAFMAIEITKRLFTIDECLRMVEAGILSESDRIELIDGELVAMTPIGAPHNAAVDRANRAMVNATGDRAIVRTQGSVGLDEYNAPQPDVVLLRPQEDFYYYQLPGPSDILLIVEVADSSLQYDRKIKGRLYARLGVPEYWIADLQNACLFAYSEPSGESYGVVREFHRGDSIAPLLLPECRFQVDVLLP